MSQLRLIGVSVMSKKKSLSDEIKTWVTVKGKKVPLMKDGTLGIKKSSGNKTVSKLDKINKVKSK